MTSTRRLRRHGAIVAVWMSLFALLVGSSPASAHEATDGSSGITVEADRLLMTAEVRFTELGYTDTSGDGLIDSDEIADQEADIAPTIVATTRDHVTLSVDGEVLEIVGAGVPAPSVVVSDGDGASLFATLVLATAPYEGDVSQVDVSLTFHVASSFVVLIDDTTDVRVDGELGDDDTLSFSLDGRSSASTFLSLGVDHIVFGAVHLLSLLALTLAVVGVAVSRNTTRRVVKLVVALALGHAVGLVLTYYELVSIPSWVVVPAILLVSAAAVVSAVRGRAAALRPSAMFFVSLIEGLGSVSTLGIVGAATSERFVALAAFDVGALIAQTAFVLLVIGMLWSVGQVAVRRRRRSGQPTPSVQQTPAPSGDRPSERLSVRTPVGRRSRSTSSACSRRVRRLAPDVAGRLPTRNGRRRR